MWGAFFRMVIVLHRAPKFYRSRYNPYRESLVKSMDDRLDFFRAQMAAFDGAADPRGAIDKGFYIEEPRKSATIDLFKRIALKPESRSLLVGGTGTGKTTQLFKIEQLLKEKDIYPHYVDLTEFFELQSISDGVLQAIFGLELIQLMTQMGVSFNETLKSEIHEYAYGSTEVIDLSGLPDFMKDPIEIQKQLRQSRNMHYLRTEGVLSKSSQQGKESRINSTLKSLIAEFSRSTKRKPFFLLDGLDRLHDINRFIALSSALGDIPLGFLIVGPVNLLYSSFADSIDNYFQYFEYRSAFDVEHDASAKVFMKSVLLSRSTPGFIRDEAINLLIGQSGGVLRDLINLAQEAIQETYLSDDDTVDEQHVLNAVYSLGRAKMLGLNDYDSDVISKISNEEDSFFIPSLPGETTLLSSGRILEYRYPKRRFAVHPVLQSLLSRRVTA